MWVVIRRLLVVQSVWIALLGALRLVKAVRFAQTVKRVFFKIKLLKQIASHVNLVATLQKVGARIAWIVQLEP
jgi:hypothetical protein